MSKSNPNMWEPAATPMPEPQFVPFYYLTQKEMDASGIKIEQASDGSVHISAIVEPCNYFNSDFCMALVRKYGERAAEQMLDTAGQKMSSEIFMANFRRMLENR